MTVFVTGATGVLGRPVIRMLTDMHHSVRALSRSPENDIRLRDMGVEPVRGDLWDTGSLSRAAAGADAILHLATHIPPSNQATTPGAWRENDRIRIEGTRNLINVALESGVSTFIYPGIVFVYPDAGSQWIDAATKPVSSPWLASSLAAEAEVQRFMNAGKGGIVLRMGAFYGSSAASTRGMLHTARRWGIAMVFGSASAYQPYIWIEDAAVAVVDALTKAPAGIYDIVDDEPLQRREIASALAQAVGRKRLFRPPTFLLRLLAGKNAMFLARSQRVSNRAFKEATGWTPTVASARLGFQLLAIEP